MSVSDRQWLRSIGVHAEPDGGRDVSGVVDLDGGFAADRARAGGESVSGKGDSVSGQQRPRRYTPWVLGVFVVVVAAAATAATTLGVTLSGPDHPSPPRPHPVKSSTVGTLAAAPVPPPPAPADVGEQPLPFIASADCPLGSTSAQSIADPEKPSPWICLRRTEGQPLYITLGPGIERSYVITEVAIVPGDTGTDQSGKDAWLQHRVVSKLQWQFNDPSHTVIDQDTGGVHGEAPHPVAGITASKIVVIIRETARPVAPAPTTTTGQDDGPLGGIFGGPVATTTSPDPLGRGPSQNPDPSDGTFAVSSIKILGHKAA